MQAAQEHIHADKGKGGNDQADDRPPSQHPAAPACHQSQMQPDRVIQPNDKCPSFLRVPAPIATPRIGRPQCAENGGDGEKQETDGNRFVHDFFNDLRLRQP